MKESNLVSVIIPCYNAEHYIEECLQSVYSQTHSEVEIICVDNNSTDNTFELLKKQEDKGKIKLYKELKKGASIARNTGFRNSSGDFIQFLDADDVIDENKFSEQLEVLKNSDIEIVVSDRIVKNITLSDILEEHTFKAIDNNALEVAISKVISSGNPLYKREIVKKVKGYDGNLLSSQDWDFHIRLVLSGAKFTYLPGYFFISRRVAGSLSSNWIEVGFQAAKVITGLKEKLIDSGNITDSSLFKIQAVLYESAINAKNRIDRKNYLEEINYWLDYKRVYYFSSLKKNLVLLFGMKFLIKLERIKKFLRCN